MFHWPEWVTWPTQTSVGWEEHISQSDKNCKLPVSWEEQGTIMNILEWVSVCVCVFPLYICNYIDIEFYLEF